MTETTIAPAVDSTELVVSDDAGQANEVMALVQNFGAGNPNFNTSLAGGTIEDRMRLFGAISDPVKVDSHLEKEIKLVDWVIQNVEMPVQDAQGNATGELASVPRVTLIDLDGTAYVGSSKPLADAADMLIFLAGKDWNADGKFLSVMVKRVPTSKPGRTTFKLVPFKPAKK